MYDNSCKFLIETYPADFAAWLIGQPIPLTELQPTELASDPIRADSLLLQGDDVVLQVEFQTQPDPTMPRRMADYFLRIHKKFPQKRVKQVVIYLRTSRSPLVYETEFQAQGMTHRFEVLRLWEQPQSVFWDVPGLLPLAILSQAAENDAVGVLQEIQRRIPEIVADEGMQRNLEATTAIFAGLKLEADVIQQVMRSRAMQESTFYQAMIKEARQEGLQAGRQEGRQEGRVSLLQKIVPLLQGWAIPIEPILKVAGVTLEELKLDEEAIPEDVGELPEDMADLS
ncbi:Rpn family recombination-promoting nuclease/putative transposase [Spirulina sp. CCNP1310]|uniref:Rpn family recombination-promoting nuclease/putative transposase n=1 Tax=Spirulina sp. CCNP1310 TaxID=3110249 RepID=UPI002B20C1DF|nr:Rpn family recombination-promoting nuclease/putative transposase [Spirulina sp. CCNP1310]MEA5421059.1 Rpn family recombination-promoting nuclease/putative transposase [Spirulina sp. CCNP1310]